jgi:hypothetical protein
MSETMIRYIVMLFPLLAVLYALSQLAITFGR